MFGFFLEPPQRHKKAKSPKTWPPRCLCALLALALTLALAGCSSLPGGTALKNGEIGKTGETGEAGAPPLEIKISFWNVIDYMNGDALQTYIEDKFNIKFVPVNMNYDDYAQQLQQLAASDTLPDIFANDLQGTSTYDSWVEQGKIRSVPRDLSAYPNLQRYLALAYNQQFKRENGSFYMIPRLTYDTEEAWALDRCIMVRKDWMEALGLSAPQSWAEFTEMLEQFVHGDPDGNGLADTEGLVSSHLNTFEALYLSTFPELSNTERGWMYEDGQWMPVYASKKTGAALQRVQDLYRAGLIVPNFAYMSTNEALDAFATGKAGAIAAQYYGLASYMIDLGMKDEAASYIEILPTWPADDGNTYRFTTSLHWSESYFGAGVSDEKMQRICQLYDWLLSDEYKNIQQYGLEGVDWDMVDGTPVLRDANALSPNLEYSSFVIFERLVRWNQQDQYTETPANKRRYGEAMLQDANEMLGWFATHAQRVNYNFDVIFMSVPSKNSLVYNREVQDDMVQVIMGDADAETAWQGKLAALRQNTTLTQAIADVTAEAAARGITP
ncbi:MAG: extracellular solute-binding protein [Gemmiger sp.]|nr:extracellular solute-binding protein [Gemmiger sp.]